MTYEEALKSVIEDGINLGGYGDYIDTEALPLCAKALEKQIPKKPMVRNYANWSGCECGMKIYEQFKYCPYCGQAIDWKN